MKNCETGSIATFAAIHSPFPGLDDLTAKAVCLAAVIKKNFEELGG